MRLKQWFERFVNQWCLINVPEMHFTYRSIIWAKFVPLNCILKLRFQNLTSPGIKLSCWLWFSSFCHDIHFQKTEYLSAVRHKIKIANYYFGSEKTDIEYTCNVSFFVLYNISFSGEDGHYPSSSIVWVQFRIKIKYIYWKRKEKAWFLISKEWTLHFSSRSEDEYFFQVDCLFKKES